MKKIILVVVLILIAIWGFEIYSSSQTQIMEKPIDGHFVGIGEHCGGNMATAASCVTGSHCAPASGSHLPFGDVGGVCVKD